MTTSFTSNKNPSTLSVWGWLLFGLFSLGLGGQTVLESAELSGALMSNSTWEKLVTAWSGKVESLPTEGAVGAKLDFLVLLCMILIAGLIISTVGSAWISRRSRISYRQALAHWSRALGRWASLSGVWFVAWLLFPAAGLVLESVDLLTSLGLAGAAWSFWNLSENQFPSSTLTPSPWPLVSQRAVSRATLWGIAIYTVVFTAMNWGLWFNLRLPHGDSAMYEEHLWNLEHGKGFRSYLDQGLFLGEHIQVIHCLFIPFHLIWSSHLLLELGQSLVLALGAIPVYQLARHYEGGVGNRGQGTGNRGQGFEKKLRDERTVDSTAALAPRPSPLVPHSSLAPTLLSLAYLLYVPLQYLDISIDLKTFRPNSLGIPPLLCAIYAMERGRYGRMFGWMLLTLSAQEDFAIALAPLGVWLALFGRGEDTDSVADRSAISTMAQEDLLAKGVLIAERSATLPGRKYMRIVIGLSLAAGATLYVLVVVKFVLPWFREGQNIHYVRYFSKLGETPTEILTSLVTRPMLLIGELVKTGSVLYATRLLLPLAGLPLLSPSRLACGAPLFLLLCLNDLAQQPPAPVHHFHASLIPFLFWSAAAGLYSRPHFPESLTRLWFSSFILHPSSFPLSRSVFVLCTAVTTGLFVSMSPFGFSFWDSGRATYWRTLYVPDERPEQFAKVFPLIPVTSRVASTDYVHPRFTHHLRSYDYSGYHRKVAGETETVPADTEFIVIDTRHPYSRSLGIDLSAPEALPEYREHPERWEPVNIDTHGDFLVLKRRESPLPP